MASPAPLVVFAYDFPHKKTYEGLLRLHLAGIPIALVIGAPFVQLHIRESAIRVAPAKLQFLSARHVCDRLGIPYVREAHNSPETVAALRELAPRVGVVLGARILSQEIIDCFSVGVINAHPGLIPENRGLDNVKWAILLGLDQGVTTHLIAGGKDVDLGRLIERQVVPVLPDDTLLDVHLRIQNTELEMMVRAVEEIGDARGKCGIEFPPFRDRGTYRACVPPEIEERLLEQFREYRDGWRSKNQREPVGEDW